MAHSAATGSYGKTAPPSPGGFKARRVLVCASALVSQAEAAGGAASHEWVDAAVSGAIGLVAVPPVLLGTAYGIWKENQLDKEVWQVVRRAGNSTSGSARQHNPREHLQDGLNFQDGFKAAPLAPPHRRCPRLIARLSHLARLSQPCPAAKVRKGARPHPDPVVRAENEYVSVPACPSGGRHARGEPAA